MFGLLCVGLPLLDSPPGDADCTGEHEEVDQDHGQAGTRERPDQTVLVVEPTAARKEVTATMFPPSKRARLSMAVQFSDITTTKEQIIFYCFFGTNIFSLL